MGRGAVVLQFGHRNDLDGAGFGSAGLGVDELVLSTMEQSGAQPSFAIRLDDECRALLADGESLGTRTVERGRREGTHFQVLDRAVGHDLRLHTHFQPSLDWECTPVSCCSTAGEPLGNQ